MIRYPHQKIISTLARELESLAGLALRLDDHIGALPDRHELHEDFQSVDFLRQSLDDIAVILDGLSAHEDMSAPLDLSTLGSALKLRELRERVLGLFDIPPEDSHDSGAVHLF